MNTITSTLRQSEDFTNKVFGLFGLSLLVTGFGVFFGFRYMLEIFINQPLFMYLLFGLELLLIFTSGAWHKKEPLNKILFALFTFSSGLTIVPLLASFASEFGGFAIIYNALFSTTAMFLVMGAIGWTSKRSFTGLSGFLFMALIGLLIISLIGIFIPWGNTGEILVSGAGVLIFAAYAMVDMNRLKQYGDEQYVLAAMQLYLDIFNLFIFVLRLSGALSRD